MDHEEKVVQWFNAVDWIQAGSRIAAILVVTFLLVFIARRLISGLEKFTATHAHDVEAQKRAATVSNVLRKLATILITGIATLAIFNTLGISILPFLATAGVAGIAIAFGAQSLVKDFFRGFFLLAENQIRQGDVVEVAGKSGLVEDLTLRYVQLRDYEGNVHYVPNGEIGVVTSSSRTFAYAVVDVTIALDQDIAPVIDVMRETGAQLRAQLGVRREDPRRPGHRRHRGLERSRHHAARALQGARARAVEREARIPAAAQARVRQGGYPAAALHRDDRGARRAGAPGAGARRPAAIENGVRPHFLNGADPLGGRRPCGSASLLASSGR